MVFILLLGRYFVTRLLSNLFNIYLFFNISTFEINDQCNGNVDECKCSLM